MEGSYTLTAANDNALGRAVVVYMAGATHRNLDVLAEIFAGLMNEVPPAANDNTVVCSQKGDGEWA